MKGRERKRREGHKDYAWEFGVELDFLLLTLCQFVFNFVLVVFTLTCFFLVI